MSGQTCVSCKMSNSYLSRHQGRLLCPQCLFEIQQSPPQVDVAAPKYEEVVPAVNEYREPAAVPMVMEEAKVQYYQQEIPQEFAVEERPQVCQEEETKDRTLNLGPACSTHGRPSSFYCLCSVSSYGRVYLCEECISSHCNTPGLRHEPLPVSAGVDDPQDIPSYRERVVLLDKINTLKVVLNEQKALFDTNCTATLESLKQYLDEVFSIMASQAEDYFKTFEQVLETADIELQTWSRVDPRFSKETELLLHHCEIRPDQYIFLNFHSIFQRRVSFQVYPVEMSLHPFNDLIKELGEFCPCQRCETTRALLGIASVIPWTCLNCKTVRTQEKACENCGCGKTKADYLRYMEVELRDHDTRWICKNCTQVNDVEILTCTSCHRKADRPKKTGIISSVFSHFVNP